MNHRFCVPLAALLAVLACATGCTNGDSATGGSAPKLTAIAVSPANPSVPSGKSQQFTARASYGDGSSRDVSSQVSWSSSQPPVASIDPASGLALANGQGSTNVVAALSGVQGATALTVTAPVPVSIRIDPGNAVIASGTTQAYTAYVAYSDGSAKDQTASTSWSSSDTTVARFGAPNPNQSSGFNPANVATGVNQGTVNVTAGYQGVQGQTQLSVTSGIVFGGGDALSALALVGNSWYSASPNRRLSYLPDAGSLLAAYTASNPTHPKVSYCQTGETVGKNVIVGPTQANGVCGDYSSQPQGFSANGPDPDFAVGELPIDQAQFSDAISYKSARSAICGSAHCGTVVQFPAIAASIGVFYNLAAASSQINLTDQQLGDIFRGKITDWSDSALKLNLPSRQGGYPITIVYRSDPSAATFALANHLSYAFNNKIYNSVSNGVAFTLDTVFTNVVKTLPGGAQPANGNTALLNLVAVTNGAIGYGEAADARLRNSNLTMAKVNGFDPFADVQSPTPQVIVLDNKIVGPVGSGSSTGRPASGGVAVQYGNGQTTKPYGTTTTGSTTGSTNYCLELASPDSYANLPNYYPILTISYLLGYFAGYGNAATQIQDLLAAPYSAGVKQGTSTIGLGSTGFAFLSLTTTGRPNNAAGQPTDTTDLTPDVRQCVSQ